MPFLLIFRRHYNLVKKASRFKRPESYLSSHTRENRCGLDFCVWLLCIVKQCHLTSPGACFIYFLFKHCLMKNCHTCGTAEIEPLKASVTSLKFSSVTSNSFETHGLLHARPLCPSPTPRVYSSLCSLNQWCHPTISSSVIPFFSCLQSFPASGSFQMSQFFTSSGQSIGVSTSASVLSMSIQDWFPLGWTGWISLQSKDSQESSLTPQFKSITSLVLIFLYSPTLTSTHDYWKNHSFD